MQFEDEVYINGINVRLVDAGYSKTIPWRAYDDNGFLAGGMTRDKVIEASQLTIDNRIKKE